MANHSLKSRKMIYSLLKTGKKCRSGHLTVFYSTAETADPGRYRAAFLVPKIAGGAVERNRIKRWLREEVRRADMKQKMPDLLALRFNGTAEDVNHQLLSLELEKIIGQIKIDG
ncbi:hypothetical protein TRIP_C10025 [Candidatus Zixiibacteriota bacterium]|nr:hypothetical protein TRIP_C10025 [candidate division Zixibacteria bacterium]